VRAREKLPPSRVEERGGETSELGASPAFVGSLQWGGKTHGIME